MNPITQFLKELRNAACLTQKQVSDALGHTTAQYVSNYERGLCSVSRDMAIQLTMMMGGNPHRLRYLYAQMETKKFAAAMRRQLKVGPKRKLKPVKRKKGGAT